MSLDAVVQHYLWKSQYITFVPSSTPSLGPALSGWSLGKSAGISSGSTPVLNISPSPKPVSQLTNAPRQLTLDTLFDYLEELKLTGVIAGGAAVRYQDASDIDVFILGGNPWECQQLANKIGVEWLMDGSQYGEIPNALIATCYPDWSSKPIQIIASQRKTVLDLLDHFDTSIHMVALTDTDVWVKGAKSTETNQPFQVFNGSDVSMARADKLAARYGVAYEVVAL